ncbi:MAG: polysaccharide biosynthesis C-terminal domain-containing protein, partial [Bacteroidota bacterium]
FVFGAIGAAIGVVAGELCTVALMWLQVRKTLSISFWSSIVRPVVASCIMIASAVLFKEQSIILQILISLAVYVVTLLLLRGIESKEIQFLRERFV